MRTDFAVVAGDGRGCRRVGVQSCDTKDAGLRLYSSMERGNAHHFFGIVFCGRAAADNQKRELETIRMHSALPPDADCMEGSRWKCQ